MGRHRRSKVWCREPRDPARCVEHDEVARSGIDAGAGHHYQVSSASQVFIGFAHVATETWPGPWKTHGPYRTVLGQ